MIFTNPQPSLAQIRSFYPDYLYENKRNKKWMCLFKALFNKKRLNRILKLHPDTKKLLDVGIANGSFLQAAKAKGLDIWGTELSENSVKYCKKLLKTKNIFIGDLSHVPGSDFDVITMWDVIEHFVNPEEYIAKAGKLLKEGGILAIQTMDTNTLNFKFAKNKWAFFCGQHLFCFNKKLLLRLVERNGFRLIKTVPYDVSFMHLLLFFTKLPEYLFFGGKFPYYFTLFEYYFEKKSKS